jgi:uncharacterized lipoprotein NlpE involved in copper resistance
MRKSILFSLFLLTITIISCNKEKDVIDNEVEDITQIEAPKTAENSLNYEGTYEGTLPCLKDDCKEVELSIKLLPDHHYIYSVKRINIDNEPLLTTGIFEFEKDGNTIVLPSIANVPNSFLIKENKIYQLDKNQERIKGENAEKFVLNKQ